MILYVYWGVSKKTQHFTQVHVHAGPHANTKDGGAGVDVAGVFAELALLVWEGLPHPRLLLRRVLAQLSQPTAEQEPEKEVAWPCEGLLSGCTEDISHHLGGGDALARSPTRLSSIRKNASFISQNRFAPLNFLCIKNIGNVKTLCLISEGRGYGGLYIWHFHLYNWLTKYHN